MPRTQPTPTPLDRLRRRRSMACMSVAPREAQRTRWLTAAAARSASQCAGLAPCPAPGQRGTAGSSSPAAVIQARYRRPARSPPPPPLDGQRVALGQPRPPCIAQGARRPPRACTRVAAHRSACHPARYRRPAHSSPAVQATPPLARSRCQVWAHGFRFAPAMPRHGPRPPTLRAAPRGARSPALVEGVAVTLGVGARCVVPSAGGVAMGGVVVGLGVAKRKSRPDGRL